MKLLGGDSDRGWKAVTGSAESDSLTSNEVFEILSNHRRRMVLYFLRKDGTEITVKELAEKIAAAENEVAVEDLTSQQRKRVYVSLYQTHLPKMEQTNVIDYDEDEGIVRLTDRTRSVDQYLTKEEPSRYPWTLHYVVLAVLGGTFVVLSWLGAPIFGAVPPLWPAVATLALYLASVAVHFWAYRNRRGEIPAELAQYDS